MILVYLVRILTWQRRARQTEERLFHLKENQVRQKMMAKQNRFIMMDPSGMDEKARD
jgi:hypothetical protein